VSRFERTCEAVLDTGQTCGKPGLEQWTHRVTPEQTFDGADGFVLCRDHVASLLATIMPVELAEYLAGMIESIRSVADQIDEELRGER